MHVGSSVYSKNYTHPGELDINDGYFAQVRINLQKKTFHAYRRRKKKSKKELEYLPSLLLLFIKNEKKGWILLHWISSGCHQVSSTP